jgi:hypothetical protein
VFGFSGKSDGDAYDQERLDDWDRSPSEQIAKPRSKKAKFLLAHVGHQVEIAYYGERRVVVPQFLFRKPEYDRSYLQAISDGESKTFKLDEITIPRQSMVKRPRKESAATATPSMTALSCLVSSAVLVGACFLCCGGMGTMFVGSNPTSSPPVASVPARRTSIPVSAPLPQIEPPTKEEPAEIPEFIPVEAGSPVVAEDPPATEASIASTFGREFADKTGAYRTRAEFVEFQADSGRGSRVIMRKENGQTVDVAMNSLSADDQEWIRAEVKRRRK